MLVQQQVNSKGGSGNMRLTGSCYPHLYSSFASEK